ncbi:MAG: glycosyl hydrolase family 18 protein [Proteobacteria bacterium]|nr:glycosyl hydrolase family 18 protein [Pseudomonadota bacterium]
MLGFSTWANAAPPSSPRFVVYYNSDASPASDLIGLLYTHVILSFVTTRIGSDNGIKLVLPDRLAPALELVPALQADGKKVLISFGGGDMRLADYLPLVGREQALADKLVSLVGEYGLDGLDIDFETSATLHTIPPEGAFDRRKFLISLTYALRNGLGDEALISHAPQSPYLDPAWHNGPYLEILRASGDHIDWLFVQYYNNQSFDEALSGAHDLSKPGWTYDDLVGGKNGLPWPSEKTIVGLPIYSKDASNGYMPPKIVLNTIVLPLMKRYGDRFGGLGGGQFSTLTSDHQFLNTEMATGLLTRARNETDDF